MERITSLIDHKLKRFNDVIVALPSYSITLFILLAAFLALLPEWLNYDIMSRDGAHLYLPVAGLFLQGKFHEAVLGLYHPTYPLPLYEFLTFLVAKIFAFDLELSGRLVSAAGYIIGAVGIYKASDVIFKDKIISLLSVLFYLSNRELLDRADDCLIESLLVCLVVWGNYFVLKGINSLKRAKNFTIGTIFFVSGALVRSTSLIFLIAWLLIWVFYKKDGIIKRMSIFLLPIVAIILLWFFRDSLPIVVGPIFNKSYNLKMFFSVNIGFFNTIKATLYFLNQFIDRTHYLVGLFGIYGIFLMRRNIYALQLSIAVLLLYVVCMRMGWNFTDRASDRYILVGIICLLPMSAYAVNGAIKSTRKFLKIIAVLTIIACPFLWADKAFDPPDPDKLARKEAGQWILSQVGSKSYILTDRERIVFYADGIALHLKKFKQLRKKRDMVAVNYRIHKWISFAELKEFKTHGLVIAIDMKHDNSKIVEGKLKNLGYEPDKKFRTVYVYLPNS